MDHVEEVGRGVMVEGRADVVVVNLDEVKLLLDKVVV